MQLRNGYAHNRNSTETKNYRYMTVGEAKKLRSGERIPFESLDGMQRDLTINGAPKVWKRKFSGVSVPIKYGLYEYARIEHLHAQDDDPCDPLLVEV